MTLYQVADTNKSFLLFVLCFVVVGLFLVRELNEDANSVLVHTISGKRALVFYTHNKTNSPNMAEEKVRR